MSSFTSLSPSHRRIVVLSDLWSYRSINVENFGPFYNQLGRAVMKIGVPPGVSFEAALFIAFQLTQNIRDHASWAPDDMDYSDELVTELRVEILSYEDILRREVLSPHLKQWARGRSTENLKAITSAQDVCQQEFILLRVYDDGIGIAARQRLNPSVYAQPFPRQMHLEELEAFSEALKPEKSCKLATGTSTIRGDPGFGFLAISGQLALSRGFAYIRSGHCFATNEGTNDWRVTYQETDPYWGTLAEVLLPLEQVNAV
jgi:hypothetical protein